VAVSLAELVWLVAPPLCWGCGDAVRSGGPICGRCRAGLRWLEPRPVEAGGVPVWAPVAYDGAARALVAGLKFRGASGLADAMAAQVAAGAPAGWLEHPADRGPPALVPVPLHPARQRRRGFNQAESLARAVAKRTGLPVARCLCRDGPRTPQVGRGRVERLSGVCGAIELRRGHESPARAIIVDDVITTGATVAACAAALRAAGGRELAAIAYARTPAR
jgi:ComF family protein